MRPLILRHSLSLAGYAAPPPGVPDDFFVEYDEDQEFVAHMAAVLGSTGVHAMGAQTYRNMAAHWPYQDGPEAEAMNTIPKIVFSRRLDMRRRPNQKSTRRHGSASVLLGGPKRKRSSSGPRDPN